jgi:hypothetical protein
MKYVKSMNELFTNYTIYPYELILDGLRYVEYRFKTKSNIEYMVEFKYVDEKWQRNFKTITGSYRMTGDNDAYNVLATVTEITVKFLRRKDVSFMDIEHIPAHGEPMNNKVPNKRSRVNKVFLQKWLPDDYTYRMVGSTSKIRKTEI